jgi:hypothetical protein
VTEGHKIPEGELALSRSWARPLHVVDQMPSNADPLGKVGDA